MGGRRGRAGARRPAGRHGLRLRLFLAVLPSVLLGAGSPGVGGLSPADTSRKEPGRRRPASAGAFVRKQAESPSCPQRGSAQG